MLKKKKKWHRKYNEVYIELPFSELWRTAVTEVLEKTQSIICSEAWILTQLAQYSFLFPLKTSENQRFSDVFMECRNGTLDWNQLINICCNLESFEFC